MALFFGVNIGLASEAQAEKSGEKAPARQPSFWVRWLFRRRQARLG